jgi:microcystin-dependent protein
MKKNIGILFTFLTIFGLGILIFKPAIAQDASLLPNAVQQFFDSSGKPLASGKVYFYEVGTSTFKDTYTSSAATTPYQNPITLNAGGKPPGSSGIYGIGLYRQLVRDKNNNIIWDAVTAPGGGGGSTPTDVGDGNLVGTVLPWSGLVAPNQYTFAYGQELARSTYPEFFTAVTQQANVICSSASNILTGISDTSQIPIGADIELSLCVIAGTTVISKTSSTVTLSNPSSVSINTVATFFPYGNGNRSTTFNVPDLRGYVLAGRDNMGGSASSRLTSTYFGSDADALGAVGGSQSHTQTISEMAAHDHTLTDPGHSHKIGGNGAAPSGSSIATITNYNISGVQYDSQIVATGITMAITGASVPFSIVQPTITLNYIIKITPDTSTSIATGVYSIGGMSGVISCGTGILCTGNIINFNGNVLAGGSTRSIQFRNSDGSFGGSDNLVFISPDTLTLGVSGSTMNFDIYGLTSGRVRQNVQAVAGTPTIVWGNASGTPAVIAAFPLEIDTVTGTINCDTCATGSLNGQALTKIDDTNITLTLGGSSTTALLSPASLTLGWTGTLAAGRLNSNVVQAITNDTNITGSISAQNLTLGWTGQLAVSRGGTGLSSGTSGGIPYFNSTSTMASSGVLGANQIVLGGGASASPTSLTCAASTTVVHGGTPPTCSQIVAADITTNTITNSNLSQIGAATIKGNPTASTANTQDFTFGSLTQTISPGATDWIPIYDNATGTIKKVNAGIIASASVAGVSSIAGNTGAFTLSTGITNSANNIIADISSEADFEAGTANKLLDANVVFTAEITTTYGTTTTFDFDTFINSQVILTGNITTMNCSNMKQGQAGTIAYIQDGVGSRTAAFNTGTCSTVLKFANASFPTLTTSASAIDILSYSCRSSTYCAAALSKGYNP